MRFYNYFKGLCSPFYSFTCLGLHIVLERSSFVPNLFEGLFKGQEISEGNCGVLKYSVTTTFENGPHVISCFSSPPKDLLKRFMRSSHQMDLVYYLSKSIGVLEKFSMRSIFKIWPPWKMWIQQAYKSKTLAHTNRKKIATKYQHFEQIGHFKSPLPPPTGLNWTGCSACGELTESLSVRGMLATVFPRIVSAETILFWKLECGKYSREETILYWI